MEYQRAARMPVLQLFILDLEERLKLGSIFHQTQNVLLCLTRRKCFYRCSRLRYFTLYVMLMHLQGWTKTLGLVSYMIYRLE
jgi:hypothetical protein